MSVKKLSKHSGPDVRYKVGPQKGTLLLELVDGQRMCLVLDAPDNEDYRRISQIPKVQSARFIGPQAILDNIKTLTQIEKILKREIIVHDEVEVIFQPESAKVRIRKDQVAPKPAEEMRQKEMKVSQPQGKKKVLIIDDSRTIQKLLTKIIESSDLFEVMAVADRPSVAKAIIEKEKPDLITLDIHMPEMNGVEFLKTYLHAQKIPTAMVSSVSVEEGPLVMEALSNGALTYIQKPSLDKINAIAPDVLEQLESISRNKEEGVETQKRAEDKSVKCSRSQIPLEQNFAQKDGIIVIGSSTGGTKALQEILTALPSRIPPIVIVQHIPAVFSKALAERLDGLCPFKVKEAEEGEEVLKNHVYIAPGGQQMKLEKNSGRIYIKLTDDAPVNRFKPSVDYLFDSVPALRQKNIVGAILTGMGKDGAQGLLKLKQNGHYTIAQDESSCVVFGMPREAIRLNAQVEISHLADIPNQLKVGFNKDKERKSA